MTRHGIARRDALLHPVFVASLGASAVLHAVALGILPPLTEILPWPTARALEVTLLPPRALPEQSLPQVTHVPVVQKHAVHKSRAAHVAAPAPVAEPAPAPRVNVASVETAPAVASETTKPVLVQEEAKPASVTLAPVGGTEPSNVTRGEPKERVAALKPSEPIVPPSFNAAYLRNPAPRYPLVARLNGEQGTVTIKVLVKQDGLPGSVTLEKTSGFALLDAAALQTVRRWRFVPARVAQNPVEAWVIVPIVFRLEEAT